MDYTDGIRKSGNYIAGRGAAADLDRDHRAREERQDRSPPTGPSPRRASSSAASTWSRPRTSTRRSSSPPASPPRAPARSRCGRSCRRRPSELDPRHRRGAARRFRLPGGAMDLEAALPRGAPARPRHPHPAAARLRPRRGDAAGGLRRGARAVAARRACRAIRAPGSSPRRATRRSTGCGARGASRRSGPRSRTSRETAVPPADADGRGRSRTTCCA